MKIYGREAGPNFSDKLLKLDEVTIQTSSENLRAIAQFIVKAAEQMDRMGDGFGHLHLKIEDEEFGALDCPDIVVHR